jgi:predicted TIM-barrel enzyme
VKGDASIVRVATSGCLEVGRDAAEVVPPVGPAHQMPRAGLDLAVADIGDAVAGPIGVLRGMNAMFPNSTAPPILAHQRLRDLIKAQTRTA